MAEQFENPKAAKLKDETMSDETAQQKIDRVADKAAGKSAHTVQKYDKDHAIVSH
jgi:hypothetical protein